MRLQRGGDEIMLYKIIRVYEVPADNQQQATDRMMEALVLAWRRISTSKTSFGNLTQSQAKAKGLI
jgi:hypothetical protein